MFNNNNLILGRNGLTTLKVSTKNRGHIYVVGGSGTGKTSELYNLIIQDLKAKRNTGLVDVHGDVTKSLEKAAYHLVDDKTQRLTILDPTRGSFGFNCLEIPEGKDPYPFILELIAVFKKLWEDSWGARMEDILRNTFLTLAELAHIVPLKHIVQHAEIFADA